MESNITLVNAKKDGQVSTDSSDPNERKLARRMRIQARLEAAEIEKAKAEGTYVEEEPEQSLIEQAIETSEDTLRQLHEEGKELVTNIMVASDAKEVTRRETEEEERNARMEKLREDSALALQRLDEISAKWETIMELNGPLELFEHMKEQKAKCLDLIQQKNNLIKSFQMELKLADEKFMKGQKAMYEELSLLTRRIDDQVLLMKRAYRIELSNIEESIDVSRTDLMSKHQKEWLALFNQREMGETSNMSRKFQLVDSFHEELHKLHVDHDEQYRELRIHLETDIQILEQELEQVKALCLLNSEKLDYNYQVLKKREEENVYIKNHQKRRLNKLQDMVNTLKKKIDEKRQGTDEEFKKLKRDVERYYKNILETEKKAELFSQVNDAKFDDIWLMKDEEAKDLIEKIYAADMIIHEQILDLSWTPPANRNFTRMDFLAYKTAVQVTKDIQNRRRGARTSDAASVGERQDLKEKTSELENLGDHKGLLSHILELLADQSGFLMEEKLDELLRPYTEEERTLVRLDNVFVAIGIQTEDDLDTMRKLFLPYSMCVVCDKQGDSVSSSDPRQSAYKTKGGSRQYSILQIRELEEKVSKLRIQAKANTSDVDSKELMSPRDDLRGVDSEIIEHQRMRARRGTVLPPAENENVKFLPQKTKCDSSHPLMIRKIYVLRALKDFVSTYHSSRIKHLWGIEEKLTRKRITVSRLLSKHDILSYWEKYKELLPYSLESVWKGVLEGLTRYLSVLKERHDLNVKAQELRRQNLELKRLLSQYKIPDSCSAVKLPMILPVPNEPLEFSKVMSISHKLSQ